MCGLGEAQEIQRARGRKERHREGSGGAGSTGGKGQMVGESAIRRSK